MVSGKGEKCSVLQIKQDDKFFCRLLSKETSMSHPSFRVASVTVPFVWESQPGTPKYTLFSEDITLPPLTPPPSYYFKTSIKNKNKLVVKKRGSRSNYDLLLALFPKLSLKNKAIMSSSSSHSSSSSSSPSSSSHVDSFNFKGDIDDEEGAGGGATSPTSTLCFGIPRSTSSCRR